MKNPFYLVAGVICILVSYWIARTGMNLEAASGMALWHTMFSFAFGVGSIPLIIYSFTDF